MTRPDLFPAELFERLRQPCPVAAGTRLRLLAMPNDPDPIPVGATGTATGGNGDQVFVRWDNGRGLALVVDVDRWEILETPETD